MLNKIETDHTPRVLDATAAYRLREEWLILNYIFLAFEDWEFVFKTYVR